MKKNAIHLLSAVTSLACLVPAVSAKTFTESMQQGSVVKVNFRTRYEDVSEDGLKDSDALTTRSRLSYQSGAWNGFGFSAEFDDVTELTNKVDYRTAPAGDPNNPGTAVIADPEGTEVNQAFISYTTFNNQIKYGRQRLVLDNARFVGNVGWRQNEQTYDGISFTNKTIRYTNVTYAYIKNVNRIFGENNVSQGDHNHDSHVLNLSYTGFEAGKLIAYAYLLDVENPIAAKGLSNDTFGVRWQSATDGMFAYNLEYAKQKDAGVAGAFDADYFLAEGVLSISRFVFTLGYEVLGSDEGKYGFATPLATLHAFQGWADKFLNTPVAGIEDKYLNVGMSAAGAQFLVSYHQFDSDEGDLDYGNEIDFSVSKKIGSVVLTAKYADFSMGDVASFKDTSKFWFMADWNF
ncbi:alginate export family protein [Cellvibrio sp. pealriver]|uniref:alginate export family protein n=1 Tax=Cellvibrio sp. pealriver TaxID=1622269 RepID=UPI00066FCA52|nr:alginate export family protein [Cellvibrio sp. pealriver]